MKAPKPSTALLVLALVAVVVLFALTIGFRKPDFAAVDKDELKQRWSSARAVKPEDVVGDPCRAPLPAGQTCSFEVKGRMSLSRTLTVRTQDAVTVVLSSSGRDVPVQLNKPGQQQSVDLQVGYKGARIAVVCLAPLSPVNGCRVQVG